MAAYVRDKGKTIVANVIEFGCTILILLLFLQSKQFFITDIGKEKQTRRIVTNIWQSDFLLEDTVYLLLQRMI